MARSALWLEFGSVARLSNCYGDMHLKDILGSFVRVGYRIRSRISIYRYMTFSVCKTNDGYICYDFIYFLNVFSSTRP